MFELRLILNLYRVKFPTELEGFNEQLEGLTLAALEEMRKKYDMVLGASSASEVQKKTMNMLIYLAENTLASAGYDCSGTTTQLVSDQEFQKDLMRLSLKYLSGSQCKPEITVPFRVITTFMNNYANNAQVRNIA